MQMRKLVTDRERDRYLPRKILYPGLQEGERFGELRSYRTAAFGKKASGNLQEDPFRKKRDLVARLTIFGKHPGRDRLIRERSHGGRIR